MLKSSAKLLIAFLVTIGFQANAQTKSKKKPLQGKEYLVELVDESSSDLPQSEALLAKIQKDAEVEHLFEHWYLVKPNKASVLSTLQASPLVRQTQPNYTIRLLENYQIQDPLKRAILYRHLNKLGAFKAKPNPIKDNPDFLTPQPDKSGTDPLFDQQWGMKDNNVTEAWKQTRGSSSMVVAVIDTGVDYTHEDLAPNMWQNSGEMGLDANGKDKSTNGIDDDGNGYIDDTVGWDFVTNDNKPFDLSVEPLQLVFGGGNPGHGTHCAGNVAARGNNSIGVAGVAPNVKIMALRFISEKGQGTSADAIKAIKYAVDNGAKVLSNSWGSEGEDPADEAENKALRDIITYAQSKGVLFIAAAGNGHQGVGYDNDTDKAPSYPASYDHDNIISVAALDVNDQFGSFSNWGAKTVDIGAPGVKVFSTTVGSQYSDTVIDKYGIHVTWDGTSMATPHVAGAAALYWSLYPNKTWQQVKDAIMRSAKPIPALQGKTVSHGKLDTAALMKN